MSYRIDYQRKAYEYHDAYGDKAYVVLCEAGDNNVYEMNNQRRARHWAVLFNGAAYAVYQKIADYCGRVAGHSLELRGHRCVGDYTKDITSAIRLYDRTIKEASPLGNLFKEYSLVAEVRLMQEVPDSYARQKLSDYLTKYRMELQMGNYYGQSVQRASMKVTTTEHLLNTLAGDQGWGAEHIKCRINID